MVDVILAREPGAFVHLVVPEALVPKAERLVAAMPPERRSRVALLEGDTSAMDFGLSGAEFRMLAAEVDRIHHLAYADHPEVDERLAEKVNVRGTAEVIELARAARTLRCLVLHSTARVAGDRRGLVFESELDVGQHFSNAVDATRFRAESIARRAMRDAPIAVLRPTTIMGDSTTGELGRLDGPYLLAVLILTAPSELSIPLPSSGRFPLALVPIDFAVRAAWAIGRHPSSPGRTFHIADPSPLSAREVFELVARAGGKKTSSRRIPAGLASRLLRAPGLERFGRRARALLDELALDVRYDTTNTLEALVGTGISCPAFESYVNVLVTAVQERVRARNENASARGPNALV